MELDPSQLDRQGNYKLLIGSVVPRPIAFITTKGTDGSVNAAPFSFYNVVASEPPMIMVAVLRRNGTMKDTARNISNTREFVVNAVDRDLIETANACSADFPPDVSEVRALGIETVPSRKIGVPGVAASKVRMECRLVTMLPLGQGPNADLVIGEIVHFFVEDSLYRDGKIDLDLFRPVARLAGTDYCELGAAFSLPRPATPSER